MCERCRVFHEAWRAETIVLRRRGWLLCALCTVMAAFCFDQTLWAAEHLRAFFMSVNIGLCGLNVRNALENFRIARWFNRLLHWQDWMWESHGGNLSAGEGSGEVS